MEQYEEVEHPPLPVKRLKRIPGGRKAHKGPKGQHQTEVADFYDRDKENFKDCVNCGHKIRINSVFCGFCGYGTIPGKKGRGANHHPNHQ